MRIAEDYLTPQEAAAVLKCSVAALVRFRQERRGPAFLRVGRLIRYQRGDLVKWLEGTRVIPTCAKGEGVARVAVAGA